MEENENKDLTKQSNKAAIQQAVLDNKQLEEVNQAVLQLGVQSQPGVYPSMYRDREKRLAESAEFASQKEFDYTEYFKYMTDRKATDEGGIASRYVLENPSINNEFGPLSDMFEQRGYDIQDASGMMNLVNATSEEKELFAKYIKLIGGDTSMPEYKDFFDMINTAKTFTTMPQRYNHQDNTEISFIIDSGTTNDGLNRYWQPQLNSMGISYGLTSDEYGKVTIPIDRLASAPYFAYAFIESYDYDYSDPEKEYDEVKGNSDSQFNQEDSSFFIPGMYERSQLISINNITNDRDGGTYRYYRDLGEGLYDFFTASGIFGGYQGNQDIIDFKNNNNISSEQLEKGSGITISDYIDQREELSEKYLDVDIIDAMRPVHDTIKQAIQRMGLPQNEVVTGRTLAIATLEQGKLMESQNQEEQKSTQITPLMKNINQIPSLLAKATLTPDTYIGYHSFRDSPTEAYERLDPSRYKAMQQRLEKAIAHGKVDVFAEAIPSATESTDLMYITLDFDVSSEDDNDKSTILGDFIQGGFKSSSVKKGTDRVSIRFPASIIGGPETDAANNPVTKYLNQIKYLRSHGGQVTLLDNFLPESLPVKLEFTGNEKVPIRLKCGRKNTTTDVDDNRSIDINDSQLEQLAKTMYLMKGLKSKLFQARYLKDVYGEDDKYFLKAKDEFETQYGDAITRLALTLFEEDYLNGTPIYDLIMDTKYTLGLTDEDGNDLDLFDTKAITNYELNKRNKKKNK